MRSCLIFCAGLLVLVSCEEEPPDTDVPEIPVRPVRHDAKPSSAPGGGLRPVERAAKLADRPSKSERTPPTADLAPDQPGSVVSPFTGAVVDVAGMEPGSVIADPSYQGDEEKLFQLPEGLPLPGPLEARPVPGKAGFVFSPFNNKIIDVGGLPPGTLVADPTFPASEKKFFRVPEGPEDGEPVADEAPAPPQ